MAHKARALAASNNRFPRDWISFVVMQMPGNYDLGPHQGMNRGKDPALGDELRDRWTLTPTEGGDGGGEI